MKKKPEAKDLVTLSLYLHFHTTSFLCIVNDIGFFKNPRSSIGLEIKPKIAFTLGPSCPLQTILLNDMVGCDSPQQIVMAVCCIFYFFLFEARQTALLSAAGCHTQPKASLNSKSVPNCYYYLQAGCQT
jgi:hypothetical protein